MRHAFALLPLLIILAASAAGAPAQPVPLATGPSPAIEFTKGETATLEPGVVLFTDRDFEAVEVPAPLRGATFLRTSITGTSVVCRRPGVVYLLTPTAGRQRDSLAEVLVAQGFQRADIPEFLLFPRQINICHVYQKELAAGEELTFGKWGLLVLAGDGALATRLASTEIATTPDLITLWDPALPFPAFDAMPDLPVVTHVQVERAAPGGFHYLHEPAIAVHDGVLHAGWANHPIFEINVRDELLRGSTSRDGGLTWSAPTTWAASPLLGGESYNHPVLMEHQGRLWGFFTRWKDEKPNTEIFTLDPAGGEWQPRDAQIPGFIPFTPPRKMRDGNWIIGGELLWFEAAVAISQGDDFTRWEVVQIPRPEELVLRYPETTLFERGDELIAICRPRGVKSAPASISRDCGRTWTPLALSNFPLAGSKPLCGRLGTGQQYLISNNLEEGRTLLSIAVTAPGGDAFVRIWKIRHQAAPVRRLFARQDGTSYAGYKTEWSYPAAIEFEGKLYVIYTQGKEDCALSIIPLPALAVTAAE